METKKALPVLARRKFISDGKKNHIDILLIEYERKYYRYSLNKTPDFRDYEILLSPIDSNEFSSYILLQDDRNLNELEKSILEALNKNESTINPKLPIVIEDSGINIIYPKTN